MTTNSVQQNHQVLSKAGRGFGSAIYFFNYNYFDTIWAIQPHKTLGHFWDIFFPNEMFAVISP